MVRKVAEYAGYLLLFAVAIVVLNFCRPTLSPEERAVAQGRRWARDHPALSVNDCPRDRGNPFWFGCMAEYDDT